MCGRDWTSPDQLQAILDEAAEAAGAWIAVAPREANAMSPPREATIAARKAKPRRKPSRLEVAFESPRREGDQPGPVADDLRHRRTSRDIRADAEDEIGALLPQERPTLDDRALRVAAYLNSHLVPNGTTRVTASVMQGEKTLWSESFTLNVSNSGPLADRVRASLREYGTPLVLDGCVDSSAYDIANPSLAAWFDRPDALARLAAMRGAGSIDAEEEQALATIRRGRLRDPPRVGRGVAARDDRP